MSEQEDILPIGSRVRAFNPNEPWHHRLGTIEEGPERREQGFEFDYLVKLDEPLPTGAERLVVDRHELMPL